MTVNVMPTATAGSVLQAAKSLPPEVLDPLTQVLGWLLWLVFLGFVALLIWAGARFAYQRHNPQAAHEADAAADVAVILIAAVIASGASGTAAALLTF